MWRLVENQQKEDEPAGSAISCHITAGFCGVCYHLTAHPALKIRGRIPDHIAWHHSPAVSEGAARHSGAAVDQIHEPVDILKGGKTRAYQRGVSLKLLHNLNPKIMSAVKPAVPLTSLHTTRLKMSNCSKSTWTLAKPVNIWHAVK